MAQAGELHAEAGTSLLAMNQVTRWIATKEEMAKGDWAVITEKDATINNALQDERDQFEAALGDESDSD